MQENIFIWKISIWKSFHTRNIALLNKTWMERKIAFSLENPTHHNTVEEYYQTFYMLIKMEIDNYEKEFRYSVQSLWF